MYVTLGNAQWYRFLVLKIDIFVRVIFTLHAIAQFAMLNTNMITGFSPCKQWKLYSEKKEL